MATNEAACADPWLMAILLQSIGGVWTRLRLMRSPCDCVLCQKHLYILVIEK